MDGDGLADVGVRLGRSAPPIVHAVLFDATATTDTLSQEQVLGRDGIGIEWPSSTRGDALDARPAGDVDGDGADDFLLYEGLGELWLVYGRTR